MRDEYPKTGKTLYLNIIWHQHQPSYLDPDSGHLRGPWVRTHGTKDYYDMTSMIEDYPNIHFTVNLTSSLLFQLEHYYVERLKPYVNLKRNRINAKKYFAEWGGRTDPWIDLALKPTADFDEKDLAHLVGNTWNALSVSPFVFGRFPQYAQLKEKYDRMGVGGLTEQDQRDIKFWFYAANFDPEFLEGPVSLENGLVLDLSDILERHTDGTYWAKRTITEEDCNRIVVEAYKILASVVPLHKRLMYDPTTHRGQVEIITTPYYHPILPLIYDSDLARLCQPDHPMPSRFYFPQDAEIQVAKAVEYYKTKFGVPPTGMWPAEGAVAHDIVAVLSKQGIKWIATDEKILARSKPSNQPKYYPYALYAPGKPKQSVVIAFRDTELSDKIGFVYKDWGGEDAAEDFVRHVLSYVPPENEPDRLLSVILDGENAWEWYRYDHDGKGFQNALYRKLSKLYETRQVVTVTMTEYLQGNPNRGVPAHPIDTLPKLEWLWPGSWINANYDTWIGQEEKNRAWEYLLTARQDLAKSGIKPPDPKARVPKRNSKSWFAFRAWESLYAAEGSDWFWWYGTSLSQLPGDKPFDRGFVSLINSVYKFAKLAKAKMPKREFPLITDRSSLEEHVEQGVMARSREDFVSVLLQCDARDIHVPNSIYVTGNLESLGNWIPNKTRMYDDGTHGDLQAGDGIWTLELRVPPGTTIDYKFTNSGKEGEWGESEEFPAVHRRFTVHQKPGERVVLFDRFGVL
ncbi:MAG TPA: carbohydrate-binding module family 20 domain-containing protein [Bacteroidota bacterium]|nr:carbohydrate-binding module family 20 domain-containing protein [Bacteroidota bacterium]